MGKNNTGLLKIAESHLGQGGSRFRKYCGLSSGQAWCAAFVTFVFAEGTDSSLFYGGKKVVYCPYAIKWCQANLANIPVYLALPGDIIFFDWNNNAVPDHIGFVRERKSDTAVYTIEGNTSGGIVAKKTRSVKYVCGCFRPDFPATFDVSKELDIDGQFGYNSIACLQKALKVDIDGILGKETVKALQKYVGVTPDGSWGAKTSKAVQKLLGVTADGYFGEKSVKALQKWINKQNTNKVLNKAKALAWAEGTAKSKYAFKGGSATSAFKKAFDKYYPEHTKWGNAPSKGACCDVFAGTCIRATVDKNFPRGYTEQIAYKSDKLKKIVKENVKPYEISKPGDVICYTKNKSGSKRHVLIRGENCLYEAQYEKTYGHVNTSMSKIKTKRPKVVIFRAK